MTKFSYKELSPNKNLKDFVKRFWQIDNLGKNSLHSTVLPDGYFDLVLKIKNNRLESIMLTGIYNKEFEVVTPPNTTFIGISFFPLAAEFIFNHSIAEIHNKHEFLPLHFWELDKLDFSDFNYWVKTVSKKLRIENSEHNVDPRKLKLFRMVLTTESSMKVVEIAERLFWNSRQINRYFNNYFGLSLKSYINIVRCKTTYSSIKKGNLNPIENYTDQAHFITQIKKHTGVTPKVLAKNKNDRFIQFSTRTT